VTFGFSLFKSRSSEAGGSGESPSEKRGFTAPDVPNVPEGEPTFSRDGHHVLVGSGGGQLKPGFVSSHQAKKQALAS
jgi:hypothetical protein